MNHDQILETIASFLIISFFVLLGAFILSTLIP